VKNIGLAELSKASISTAEGASGWNIVDAGVMYRHYLSNWNKGTAD
jgi:hypothetical protein